MRYALPPQSAVSAKLRCPGYLKTIWGCETSSNPSVVKYTNGIEFMEKNFMNRTAKTFTGVVLAADRGPDDPVARTAGAPCKAFVPLGGRPMVLRVLDTLAGAREVDSLVVCGPSEALLPQEPELLSRITAGKIRWIPPQATPSESTYHVLEALSPDAPVLVTTADHAFLTAEVVDFFAARPVPPVVTSSPVLPPMSRSGAHFPRPKGPPPGCVTAAFARVISSPF